MTDSIRIVLVDNHPVVREGLATILGSEPGLEVVGQTSTGEQALDLLSKVPADVVILGVQLGRISSVGLCATFRRRHTDLRVILWTSYPNDDIVRVADATGAHGFLAKNSEPRTIREVVRAAHTNGPRPHPTNTRAKTSRAQGPYGLTLQEMRVIRLLPRGLTNREIGQELGISDQTVKTHLSSAMNKLNVVSRAQATAVVMQECWA